MIDQSERRCRIICICDWYDHRFVHRTENVSPYTPSMHLAPISLSRQSIKLISTLFQRNIMHTNTLWSMCVCVYVCEFYFDQPSYTHIYIYIYTWIYVLGGRWRNAYKHVIRGLCVNGWLIAEAFEAIFVFAYDNGVRGDK